MRIKLRCRYLSLSGETKIEIFTYSYDRTTTSYLLHFTSYFFMTLKDAQSQVDQWIKTIGVRYFSELTNTAILMEEVGELSRIMARRYGDQSFKPGDKDNLADEMAHVLWVLICLANQTGVDLDKAFIENVKKKSTRDKNRHKENSKL